MHSVGRNLGWFVGLFQAWILAGMLPTSAADAGAATLRYRFHKGETYSYVLERTMTMTVNTGVGDVSVRCNETVTTDWLVKKVLANGTAWIEQRTRRVQFATEAGPAGKVEYDSEKGGKTRGPANNLASAFAALIRNPSFFVITSDGRIDHFKLSVEAIDAIVGAPLSADDLFKQVELQALRLPAKTVVKGESWVDTHETPMGSVCTLLSKDTITYEGAIQRKGRPLQRVAIKTCFDLKSRAKNATIKRQASEGVVLFDSQAGRIVEKTYAFDFTTATPVNGQEFLQRNRGKLTLRLLGGTKSH